MSAIGNQSSQLATCTDLSNVRKRSSKNPTGRLGWFGLNYKPTNDVLSYGKYARGYRTGGVFTNEEELP